jgi:hypothetical protein
MKASRSPSPSMSAVAGDTEEAKGSSPRASATGAAKDAALGVPVFTSRKVLP